MPQTQYNLHLKGFVGGADFDRDFVDYILAKNDGKKVKVLIDSLGGNLATALSIASAFSNHGSVYVHFVGMNASAATIASLGAKHISIDRNAMYLVHKCSTSFFEWGSLNADQFRTLIADCEKAAADLDKLDVNIASMYASKCKMSTQSLLDLMHVGGWLSAKEALEWGFVDEITDIASEPAPKLTDNVASAMAAAGIPLPNLPIENKEGAMHAFFDRLTSLFANKPKPQIRHMNKTYNSVCTLLAVDSITLTDGKASLTDDQLNAIETALNLKTAAITDLEEQVAALKVSPAASTTTVVDNGKHQTAASEKNDYEKFCDSINAARKLYNEV